jgi:hypothetical protein
VHPDAVMVRADGFKMVNYALASMPMQAWM